MDKRENPVRTGPVPAGDGTVCPCCMGRGGHTEFYGPDDDYDSWKCFCNHGRLEAGADRSRRCPPLRP